MLFTDKEKECRTKEPFLVLYGLYCESNIKCSAECIWIISLQSSNGSTVILSEGITLLLLLFVLATNP